MYPKRDPERTDTVTKAKVKGTDTKKDSTAMIVTIAKTDKTKAEGTAVVEGRKFHSVSSTARIKATGQMSALSPLKEKRSLIGRIPNQQNQSIIPRSCRLSLRQRQILGLLHQIGRCRTRFSIITHSRMHHLHNNQFQCYHLRSTVRHGPEAPHHCLATQQIYHHLRNLSQGRFQSEQSMHLRVAG